MEDAPPYGDDSRKSISAGAGGDDAHWKQHGTPVMLGSTPEHQSGRTDAAGLVDEWAAETLPEAIPSQENVHVAAPDPVAGSKETRLPDTCPLQDCVRVSSPHPPVGCVVAPVEDTVAQTIPIPRIFVTDAQEQKTSSCDSSVEADTPEVSATSGAGVDADGRARV